MCLRSTNGRIGSVHVVVKCEHCEKQYGFTHKNDRLLALYKPTWSEDTVKKNQQFKREFCTHGQICYI